MASSFAKQRGADFCYANSFWNPSQQERTFYPDPDFNHNGQIDERGEFYQVSPFQHNTGIG